SLRLNPSTMRCDSAGIFNSGCKAAKIRMWDLTLPSCDDSVSTDDKVKRKAATLTAINPRVITGQRRADMFSCLIGINIVLTPCYREIRHTSRQSSFPNTPNLDDARS